MLRSNHSDALHFVVGDSKKPTYCGSVFVADVGGGTREHIPDGSAQDSQGHLTSCRECPAHLSSSPDTRHSERVSSPSAHGRGLSLPVLFRSLFFLLCCLVSCLVNTTLGNLLTYQPKPPGRAEKVSNHREHDGRTEYRERTHQSMGRSTRLQYHRIKRVRR